MLLLVFMLKLFYFLAKINIRHGYLIMSYVYAKSMFCTNATDRRDIEIYLVVL